MKRITNTHQMACYADLRPWAIALCEQAYKESMRGGRRRGSARVDFVAGWKEAARQFGQTSAFIDGPWISPEQAYA